MEATLCPTKVFFKILIVMVNLNLWSTAMSKTLTIFTPTYNRANLLSRVFKSLQQQTSFDFEWLLVDDGSTDKTETIIEEFKREPTTFPIRYFKQENGGKHRAINFGVKKAEGAYFLILDSDDFLHNYTIEKIKPMLLKVKAEDNLAGIAVRRAYKDGTIVGNEFSNPISTSSLNIRYKYHITGDLVEIFKTNILKEYPFPEYEGEKFCPEALVWNRIAQNYNLKFFNAGLYVTEYIEGGLTEKIVKIRMQSPQASMLHYAELASYDIPFKEKIKAGINFWRFAFNAKQISFFKKTKKIGLFYIAVLPLGYLMHLNDKRNNK